jgi:probable F420-dependent oxidoreductase
MKVRIGVGAGAGVPGLDELGALVDDLDELGFDSLWLADVLTMGGVDPMVGLAWAGAHNQRLKLGMTMLLPGRNLLRLAKQLASLDALSGGRLLVTFVPGLARGPERSAIGVAPAERGAVMDEALPLLRRLWSGETVTYHGAAGHFEDVSVTPRPLQDPFDVWLGGNLPAALERCGRLSDGWLPAMCTPDEAAAGRQVIEAAADRAGRSISPEHFGVSVGYARGPLDPSAAATMAARARGHALEDLVPVGLPALRAHLTAFIDVGFTKFVVRPMALEGGWRGELESLAEAVGDLQT